ncbi:Fc.00g110890.m01.CDS01 [Cosmosporella sp. VM-42]
MSARDEDGKLIVPKFSSFKAVDEGKDSKAPKFSSFKPKHSATQAGDKKEFKAPKFSSFKPKGPSSNVSASGANSETERKNRDRDSRKRSRHSDSQRDRRHSKHSRQDSRQDSRHDARHESHRRNREQSKPESRPETSDQKHAALVSLKHGTGASGLYIVDVKGDPLIAQYGSLDRSQVPSYYRYGSGRVLGTVGRLVIHRDGARDEFSLRMPGEGSAAFRDKDGLRSKTWRVRSKPMRIRIQESGKSDDENEDFLEVRTCKKRKRGLDSSDSSDADEQPTYRSIEGKAKAHQYSDSDLDYNSPDELADTDQSNPLKWKSIQLSRQVKDHPEDIDAWLELADHQDALLRAGENIDDKASENEVHSYAEIKLSMLESALSNVSNPQERERVLVPLMREGVKVWNSKTATKKWTELLADESTSFALWKTHLDFAMSDISTFQYDDIKTMYLDRHNLLSKRSGFQEHNDCSEAIYNFLRTTRFIHDSGYKELAVAAWQALLEITFFRPAQSEIGPDSESFQEFWESEVPRIGDTDAQGWRKFNDDNLLGDAPETVRDRGDPSTQSRDDYKSWANIERSRAEKANVPARTMDDGTEDDPFRVVMLLDFVQWVFQMPTNLLPMLVPEIVDAFLIFSRFPPAFRSSKWTEIAYHDQFLVGLDGGIETMPLEKPEADLSEETEKRLPSFDQGILHAACTDDLLFARSAWFRHISARAKNREIELGFVINVTRQLYFMAGVAGLAEYHLALCSINDPTALKKTGKALLKRFPTNLGLYNAYALAEFANDNLVVVTKVLASATGLASKSSNPDGFKLWRSWSWMELELGNKKLATKRLCSSVDEVLRKADHIMEMPPMHILKAQQEFSDRMRLSISAGITEEADVQAECLALLSYLTAEGCTEPTSASQGNVTAAMAVIHEASEEFKSRGYEATMGHERLLQFAARILYLNATRGPFRRAYMLEQLSVFINFFPRNTIFLALFEWADSSLRVIDGVRTLLYDKVLITTQDCISSRIFAIQHEIQRGNANTAKAAFEHAVSSDICKSSVPLWICYIRFCHTHKELRPKAKDVFYRAFRHCPWSKEVMMEAFVTLNREMDSTELRSVFNTMTSKGLRVHVDLEEFLEKRRHERRALKDKR